MFFPLPFLRNSIYSHIYFLIDFYITHKHYSFLSIHFYLFVCLHLDNFIFCHLTHYSTVHFLYITVDAPYSMFHLLNCLFFRISASFFLWVLPFWEKICPENALFCDLIKLSSEFPCNSLKVFKRTIFSALSVDLRFCSF